MNTIKSEIQKILDKLEPADPKTDEYKKMLGSLETLTYLEKENVSLLNPTWVTAGTYLVGLSMILLFERAGIITTKAFRSPRI